MKNKWFKPLMVLTKRTLSVFLILFISISSVLAANGKGEDLSTVFVNLNLKNATIEQIFAQIEEQTQFNFAYNSTTIQNDEKHISISCSNKPLSLVLKDLEEKAALQFKQINHSISVLQINGSITTENVQQQREIHGIVTDKQNNPIPGVTISLKGTAIGTVSDTDGKFSLKVPVQSQFLSFSFVGMKTQEIDIRKSSSLKVVMTEASIGLNEVVAIGYGTMKKVNLTGAVDQVSDEAFKNRSVSNVTQALQGVIPNLNITLEDGKPMRDASYNIRGTTSIGQGGSALVLIDGVEGNPALLNPNDIASVSVLKDAASAAIYGSRGSFGVVLITTKKPKHDKITVTYSSNFTIEKPTTVPDFVTDGYEYAKHFREAYYAWNNYSSLPSKINKSQAYSDSWLETFKERKEQGITDEVVEEDDGTYTYYGNTDWYDILYRNTTFSQDHNISLSGGTEKADYYMSGRLYHYNGLFAYNSDVYKMYNLRAKGSLQVLPWLRIANNMEYSQLSYHNPQNVGEGSGIWRNIADEGHPSSVLYNPDQSYTMSAAYTVGDFVYGKSGIDYQKKNLKNTSSFKASFLKNKLRVNGDFTFRNYDHNSLNKRVQIPYSSTAGETSYLGTSYNDLTKGIKNTFYTASNLYAEYENTFHKDHYFKAMAGYNYETSKYEYTEAYRNGLLLEDADNLNLALGDDIEISSDYEKWRIMGLFYRINYSYKNRYLFEFDGRYDGSSKFPEDQQYAFFPSASAGWRISEEPFWSIPERFLSNVKLRASYGSLGNGNVDPYSYLELFDISTSGRVINGELNPETSAPDPIPESLTWETATTADLGLDLNAIRNKFSFTGDYYIRKTTNMYTVGETLPDVYGADSPYGNYADMTTKGWEFTIEWKNRFKLAHKAFHYSIKGTLSNYKSVIDKYNNDDKSLDDYYKGETVGELWGYKTDGLFQTQDQIDAYTNTLIKSSSNGTTYLGDLKFVDNNGNGKIDDGSNTVDDPGDQVILGNTEPRYIFSFTLSGDWNGFFFSAFFQGVGHQDWFPYKESEFWGQYNRPYNNLPKWHLGNYWTEDNTDAYLPRYAGYNTSLGYGNTVSERYIQNIGYIRLKNLQIGYNLPSAWIARAKMQNARVYITCENLWSWSPLYKWTRDFDVTNTAGSDPELSSGTSGDNYSYPLMKSLTFGLSLTF